MNPNNGRSDIDESGDFFLGVIIAALFSIPLWGFIYWAWCGVAR